MKRNRIVFKSIAFLMATSLVLPHPAWALRPVAVQESAQRGELGDALGSVSGLEEGNPRGLLDRRDFLRRTILGIGAASLPLAIPVPEVVGQPVLPAGDLAERIQRVRTIQSQLLANQSASPPRIQVLQSLARRTAELRNIDERYVSLLEFEEALTAAQQRQVFNASNGVFSILRESLAQAGPVAAPPAQQGLFPAVSAQVQSEVGFARLLAQFFSRWTERLRPLATSGTISLQEFDILETSWRKSDVRLSILEELQRLYADLRRLGEVLPLPRAFMEAGRIGDVDIGGAIPPVPEPRQAMPEAEQNRLLATVRIRIWKILALEKRRLQLDLEFKRRWAGRIESIDEQFRGHLETADARYLRAQEAPILSQQALLTAQQKQLLLGGEGNPIPVLFAGAGLPAVLSEQDMAAVRAVVELRQEPVAVQRELDQAIRRDAGFTAALATASLRYNEEILGIAENVNRRVAGVYSGIEMNEFRANVQRARIHLERVGLQRELAGHLTALGMPEPILRGTSRFSSSLEAQSLVQPILLGLPEAPAPEEAARHFAEIRRIRLAIADAEVRILQSDVDEQEANARPLLDALASPDPAVRANAELVGTWFIQDARSWRQEAQVVRLLQQVRRKERELIGARTRADFERLVGEYEQTLVAWVQGDLAFVRNREEVLRGRAEEFRADNRQNPGRHSAQAIEFQEAKAEVMVIRRQELVLIDRLYTAMRGWLPLVDLQKTTSDAGSFSPDMIGTLLRQQASQRRDPGVVRMHGQAGDKVVWFGSRWVWLAGPPVLGDVDGFGQSVEFVQIPTGRPNAGNFVLRERLQKLKADIGFHVGVQSSASLGQPVYVSRSGPQPYQGRSGYYLVHGADGVLTISEEGIRLGLVARPDPANPGRFLPSMHGLVGFSASEVRTVTGPDGRPVQALVPIGVIVQQVSLPIYNARGEDGQEAPIPLRAQRREAGNVLDYGEFYRGGFVTYGPRGAAYFAGARNEAGQRLPRLFERVGARTSLVEKEVKVIFDEQEGAVRVSFQNHPVVQAAEVQSKEPAPAAQAQDQVPAVQEAEGLDIPWWVWAAGGTAVTGAAAYAAHKVFASGKKVEPPAVPPSAPPAEAGLEERVGRTLRVLGEASQGPGVLVLQVDAIRSRAGFLEFISRIPPDLSRRVILFSPNGSGLEEEEVRERNPDITLTENWIQLAEHLISMNWTEKIAFLGDQAFVERLSRMLPASMEVFSIKTNVSLLDILQFLGVPENVLDVLHMLGGLEEDMATLRYA